MQKTHLLIINTHNRVRDFTRLLGHIISYDNLFDKIIIICDSKVEYYNQIHHITEHLSKGANHYELIHLHLVGGAESRNYLIRNELVFNYDLVSFCDDDDIPFKSRFIAAEEVLYKNNNLMGYAPSYIRHYGPFSKKIISSKKTIGFEELKQNNDLGGFSFLTIKTKYLKNINLIPCELKSNQDWFLWLSMSHKYQSKFFFKDDLVGLVYNDNRIRDRLTLNPKNTKSTLDFYKFCTDMFGFDNEAAIRYFYYKFLRKKKTLFVLRFLIFKKSYLKKKHYVSLIKNIFFERLFL